MAKKTPATKAGAPAKKAKKKAVGVVKQAAAALAAVPAEAHGFTAKAGEVVQTILGTMAGVVEGIGILVTGTDEEKKARARAKKKAAAKAVRKVAAAKKVVTKKATKRVLPKKTAVRRGGV